jgi:heptose-I-phosphate ethanolaminephosphotransferase
MHINKALLKLGYLFLVPMVLAFVFECFFKIISWDNYFNVLENFLFAIILTCPLYILSNSKWRSVYFVMAYLFFCFCTYFETAYYYLFSTNFSSSAIFVLLDTNLDEAKEFISFYLDTPLLIFSFIFIISSLFLAFKFRHKEVDSLDFEKSKINTIKAMDSMILIYLFLKLTTLIVFNLPYLFIKSNIEYYRESKLLGNYKENKNGNFHNLKRPSNEEELYVIIIGESNNRINFGLYNYIRQTTPELNKLKEKLLIYNDVISPHVYSVGALTKILTLGNYESPEKVSDGSIIQLINSAGLDTYWLSNQRPIGPYESLITKISLSSKYHKFINTEIAGKSQLLDGELIEEFEKTLNNLKSKENVIFLHLLGAHHDYKNRYPESFNKYKDQPVTKFKSKESFEKINHYDNTILYNDYLISEVIKKTEKLNKKSFVLFFSDHGEEMYNDLNMAGHNEDIFSKNMYDIPFLLWQSEKYKQEEKIAFFPDRKYMIDDLFYSVADLLSISSNETDSTRSIFNRYFKERKRIIKDTIDYDTFFEK